MGWLNDVRNSRQMKRELDMAKTESVLARTKALSSAYDSYARQVTNSGYSHGGASRSATWARKYHSESYSAKSDIEVNRKVLRERSRDLYMNAPIAAAAVNATRTSVVGSGLIPRPKVDYEYLGMTKEQASELQRQIKKEFGLWADSTLCDNNDQNNFYELQQIAFSDWLKNGEEFALIKYERPVPFMPYQLRLKLVEADRVCSRYSSSGEYSGYDEKLPSGNRIMNGIEIDPTGKVVAYHICSAFPGEMDETKWEWTRVEKRGKRTGNPNILHLYNSDRAEQYRGVPYLAPVIHSIKQMTRYTEAEIMAAVVNSMFTIFVNTETGDDIAGFGGVDDEAGPWGGPIGEDDLDADDIQLGSGTINFLKEGESIQAVESAHPNGNYDSFIQAMANQVGAALEIAPEVLLKRFASSFSASKGALNETWKSFMMRRKWFINDFCQVIYELWFAEAVAKGRINAPGFFMDPLIRKAYTNCTWNGPAQGCLNPAQEATAAVTRIQNGLSTHEDECASINGSDFEDNVRTLQIENEKLAAANRASMILLQESQKDPDEEDDDEEDSKKDDSKEDDSGGDGRSEDEKDPDKEPDKKEPKEDQDEKD